MRVLGKNVINEMIISDAISGFEIAVFYRTPTTQEREAWLASLFEREGQEIVNKSAEANLRWGSEIMTGIADECFSLAESENNMRPISSNPDSKDYRADWKQLLCEFAPDIVEFVARRAFDGHRQILGRAKRERYDSKN